MATKVIMPQLGESVVEGTVSAWLKAIGDSISEYDPLVEVETDKVTTEIPAPATGVILEIYVGEGETVEAGTLLCIIGEPGEQVSSMKGEKPVHYNSGNGTTNHAYPKQISSIHASNTASRLTPVVARMVEEHNIDINQIEGTGSGGRITKKDVKGYLEQQEKPAWEQPGSGDLFKPTDGETGADDVGAVAAAEVAPAKPARAIPVEPIPEGTAGELIRLSRMRQSIAEHMVHSKLETAPHVTTVMEADLTNVLLHLEEYKAKFARQGVNLTLTAYFVQAMVAACEAQPGLNSQWTEDGIYQHYNVHIGMAVAVEDGLLVPVIRNAESLNLLGTARQVNDLAHRARQKQLQSDELHGSTISITNHGVSGSLFATPIINQPNAAILGVGLMEKRVKVVKDAIAIRPCCYISLTFDHRVADGASADSWLLIFKQTLENWTGNSG